MSAHRNRLFLGLLIGLAASSAASATPSCVADLMSLQGQLHSDHARAAAAISIDATITNAGGLTQATERAQTQLQQIRELRTAAGSRIAPEVAQYLDDAELLATRRIEALNCRRPAQGGPG